MTRLMQLFSAKGKKLKVSVLMAAMMLMAVGSASANTGTPAADTATVDAITNGMSSLQMTALAVVAAVAGIAIVLFAAPFAWQYGKKIFKTVAR